MALSKVLRFAVILLVLCCSLNKPGLFEELTSTKSPSLHVREKRSVEIFIAHQSPQITPTPIQAVLSAIENSNIPTTTVEVDIDATLYLPVLTVQSDTLASFRRNLKNETFPVNLSKVFQVKGINFTTVCSPNSTDVLQCECETGFGWPCDMCNNSNSCSDVSSQICTCMNRHPYVETFCQPIQSIPFCTTPTTVTTTITTNMASTTLQSSTNVTTTAMPTAKNATSATTKMPTATNATTSATTKMPTATNATTNATTSATTKMPTATNATTSATTNATTSATTNATTPVTFAVTRSFTLNMNYQASYSSSNNEVYKDILYASETNCQRFVSKDCTVQKLILRSGSTIADYTLSTSSQDQLSIDKAANEMLNQLAAKYPVQVVSTIGLQTSVPSSAEIPAGNGVQVTCGPPPVNFGSNLSVNWTIPGGAIIPGTLNSSLISTYSISNFYQIHDGQYVCKMTRADGATFTQSRDLSSVPSPQITVNPVIGAVKCPGSVTLSCSVNYGYNVTFNPASSKGQEISYVYNAPGGCTTRTEKITCQLSPVSTDSQATKTIQLTVTPVVVCKADDVFSDGPFEGFSAVGSCQKGKVGNKTGFCMAGGKYGDIQDNCVLQVIQNLLDQSQAVDQNTLPTFLEVLRNATVSNSKNITNSPATINAMVNIFENVAKRAALLNITILENSTRDIVESAGLLTTGPAKDSWNVLNNETNTHNNKRNASSSFLNSLERITTRVVNKSLTIVTQPIIFTKINFTNNFQTNFNSSVKVDIPEAQGPTQLISVVLFASMENVLPARQTANISSSVINGRVVLIQPESHITNISIAFDVLNDTLGKPQCVFWDFQLFGGLGGWSDEGCSFVLNENGTVTCNCNHTTSFSILMSPDSPKDPALDYITYIGVGISMACLVICLIIEGIVWRKIRKNATSYLRHVSLVNIALCLLIADIWFIIGAAISAADKKNPSACTAATFFIHFFYLAMFFWMLATALLLLYRTVSVFDGGLSKMSMLIIGFSLGYGAPLIIATITIAATAPSNHYIRQNVICWLNWDESKALLAFVIPALMIVAVNLIILIVVICKILKRRGGESAARAGEKPVLLVIARSLAVLTPLFGVTWGLGVGIMISPKNRGINITFALFNSLQGLFILVFGTLMDRSVMSGLTKSTPSSTESRTRSTSAGNSSSGINEFFRKLKLRQRRRSSSGYHVSSNVSTSSSSNT